MKTIRKAVQFYVDAVGLCVTVTPTTFHYTKGSEKGVAVGLINYPRFPDRQKSIKGKAIALAKILKKICCQERVSVVCSLDTVMLEETE